jgi:hypothetical protein
VAIRSLICDFDERARDTRGDPTASNAVVSNRARDRLVGIEQRHHGGENETALPVGSAVSFVDRLIKPPAKNRASQPAQESRRSRPPT